MLQRRSSCASKWPRRGAGGFAPKAFATHRRAAAAAPPPRRAHARPRPCGPAQLAAEEAQRALRRTAAAGGSDSRQVVVPRLTDHGEIK